MEWWGWIGVWGITWALLTVLSGWYFCGFSRKEMDKRCEKEFPNSWMIMGTFLTLILSALVHGLLL